MELGWIGHKGTPLSSVVIIMHVFKGMFKIYTTYININVTDIS